MQIHTVKENNLNSPLLDIFSQQQQALLGFIRKRVQDQQVAEDLLHDLFLKLQSHSPSNEVKYPKAYVYRMANNLTIDYQRRESNSPVVLSDANEQLDNRSPEQTLAYQEQLKVVASALNELPEKTQDVFKMQRIQEFEKKDVASRLGISTNMVEKHLRRAVQYCREQLKKSER